VSTRAPSLWPAGLPTLVLLALGCGTPSRSLSTRLVDDPMSLPRRMARVEVGGGVSRTLDQSGTDWRIPGDFGYGLTERLELGGLLALRYTFLDDAPTGSSTGRVDPFSLAVKGGITGIGSSDTEGLLLNPTVSLHLRKRVGARASSWLTAGWQGEWTERPFAWHSRYASNLVLRASRANQLWLTLGSAFQISNRLGILGWVGVHQLAPCTLPTCRWAARGGEVGLGPFYRPAPWLTLQLLGSAGGRFRPRALEQPASPVGPASLPVREITWVAAQATVTFAW
jgi:hypothetical protein